jgi:FkbM family methyltransferase
MMRSQQGADFEVAYIDGLWTHRIGPQFFPDSAQFAYAGMDRSSWKGQTARQLADTQDFWLQYYKPKEGDVIVDVGAGRGEDTFSFSRGVGKTGKVFAIEAHPMSFSILTSFCRLNGLSNVTCLHTALMDKSGSVKIVESQSWQENAVQEDQAGPGIQVPATTLDNICQNEEVSKINFLKMNIEGCERQALVGMKTAISRVDQICVACHDFRADLGHGEEFRTKAFVREFLESRGFRIASRSEDSRDYVRDHIFGLRQ